MTPLEKVLQKFPDARKVGRGWLAHCPVHGDEHESLGIDEGSDGKVILKCRSQGCAVEAIVAAVGLEMRDLFPEKEARPRRREDQGQAVRDLLARTIEDNGRIKAYLLSRGLDGIVPPSLRLVPQLAYFDGGIRAVGSYPAMVAAIVDLGRNVVGLHRTYLASDGDGKAPVEGAKKMMAVAPGSTRGGAIPLGIPTRVVALTEGIETGLAVQQATGTPTWAALSAGGMEVVQLPPEVRQVQVWGDRDPKGAGQKAAEKLARRLAAEGRSVEVFLPAKDGDWLDVLTADGPAALLMATPIPLEVKPQQATPPPRERPTIVASVPRAVQRPELERAVIGAFLWNPQAALAAGVHTRDFTMRPLPAILTQVQEAALAGQRRMDLPVLAERLRATKVEVSVAWLADVLRERVDEGLHDACEALMLATMRREVVEATRAATARALDASQDVRTILLEVGERLHAIGQREQDADVEYVGPTATEEWERAVRGEQAPRVSTGWEKLDDLTGGLVPGELLLVGARPGLGKSALLQQLAEQITNQGRHVCIFSLEMSRRQVAIRSLARASGISISRILAGRVPENVTTPVVPNFLVCERGGQSIVEIERIARRYAAMGMLDVIAIDYLQIMDTAAARNGEASRQDQFADITGRLKRLAVSLNIPVILAVQLNREAAKKEVPQLHHIRETGTAEADAGQVWLIYAEKETEGDMLCIRVCKNRYGKVGTVRLQWIGELTQFRDVAAQEEPRQDTRFGGADF